MPHSQGDLTLLRLCKSPVCPFIAEKGKEGQFGASEVAQPVTALLTKADTLSGISRSHVVIGEV